MKLIPAQLDLPAMHRVRDRLVTRRTAVMNQLRAFLLERGIPRNNQRPKQPQAQPAMNEKPAML